MISNNDYQRVLNILNGLYSFSGLKYIKINLVLRAFEKLSDFDVALLSFPMLGTILSTWHAFVLFNPHDQTRSWLFLFYIREYEPQKG